MIETRFRQLPKTLRCGNETLSDKGWRSGIAVVGELIVFVFMGQSHNGQGSIAQRKLVVQLNGRTLEKTSLASFAILSRSSVLPFLIKPLFMSSLTMSSECSLDRT